VRRRCRCAREEYGGRGGSRGGESISLPLAPHKRNSLWELLGRYIADFYCADARLCIEVDGDSHTEPDQVEYDADRTRALEAEGNRVIRITNGDIFRDLEGVLATIAQACERYAVPTNAPPRGGS